MSGGVNVGKSFTGKSSRSSILTRADRILSDAADAFALIDRLIERGEHRLLLGKAGRFVGAWTQKHYAAQAQRVGYAQ